MYIPQIIADKFYEHFEKELYEFTFMFKTESYLNNQSIISLCEAAVCAAHDVSVENYINEKTDVSYDTIFGDAASMTEQVINLMLARFAASLRVSSSSFDFAISFLYVSGFESIFNVSIPAVIASGFPDSVPA